ncbi:glycoside hydrolase superfamily [Lipomyces oligophaga]|uniref:glycoside hydrolase superfamily n=1 Tax=Lipomyces oligophaga TaxID=45792 RepID=UPI0034CE153A
MVFRVSIDPAGNFRDEDNRVITFRGINLAADSKLPANPAVPAHVHEQFFKGDSVSFVGRPFPLEEVDEHLTRIKSWGYNIVRYIFTWEALEHAGPGKYDQEFIQFSISVLQKIKDFGFYCYMDPHQDVWSRYSGGSGAPMWTLYAAGLDPRSFIYNEAAIVQNTWIDPITFPKMTWPTNYDRLACLTMFALFWAGKDFAPKAIIDGVNIQEFLQNHFMASVQEFALKIKDSGIDDGFILGWESINEPNRGFLGMSDLSIFPPEQNLRSYTSPTPLESLLLGSGRTLEIPVYEFGTLGASKKSSKLVNQKERSAWLPADYDDSRYGWHRDPGWKLGECLWAQHGVWDSDSGDLLIPDYFFRAPDGFELSGEAWADKYFINYWKVYVDVIRSVNPDAIMFAQTPVMAIPPDFKAFDAVVPRMVFTPHFYDGLTLVRKHWSKYWNVDVIGVLRGKYWSPMFGLRFGETAIRNCIRDQLKILKEEGIEKFGPNVPCFFSEIGIPFDMNDKSAYKDGNYEVQIDALDANIFALESSKLHHTFWVYAACNSHKWGDHWNGEDLSFYSASDSKHSMLNSSEPEFSLPASMRSDTGASDSDISLMSAKSYGVSSPFTNEAGCRAIEAFVRPTPLATSGIPQEYGFDIKTAVFNLSLFADDCLSKNIPTEISIPDFHFPNGDMEIEITSGRWEHDKPAQLIRWYHDEGLQKIKITGLRGPQRVAIVRSTGSWVSLCSFCS